MVVHCGSAAAGLLLCTNHRERIRGAVFMSPALPLTRPVPARTGHSFDADLDSYEGWAKVNRHHWARDYRDYVEFFMDECFTEPHSTKQIEDSVDWALETDGETLVYTMVGPGVPDDEIFAMLGASTCRCSSYRATTIAWCRTTARRSSRGSPAPSW